VKIALAAFLFAATPALAGQPYDNIQYYPTDGGTWCLLDDGSQTQKAVKCPPGTPAGSTVITLSSATTFSRIEDAGPETPLDRAEKICSRHVDYGTTSAIPTSGGGSGFVGETRYVYRKEWRDCEKIDGLIADRKRAEIAAREAEKAKAEAPDRAFVTAVAQGRIK